MIELRNGSSGGLVTRLDAIALGIDLEARGHVLTVAETTGKLLVSNAPQLTADDRAAIPPLVRHLVAIVGYAAPEAA